MKKILCSIHDRGGSVRTNDIYILKRGNDPILFKELMDNLRSGKTITITIDGKDYPAIIIGSFHKGCRHIYDYIDGGIYRWIKKNGLKSKDRVILEVIIPYKKFKLSLKDK